MPERFQRKRTAGSKLPPGTVCVDRSSKLWGNPFRVGDQLKFPFSEVLGGSPVRDQAHAVELFRAYARISCGYVLLVRMRLAGKDLACWCRVGDPCHGDVLLEVANSDEWAQYE